MAKRSASKNTKTKDKVVPFPQPKRNVFSRMAATFEKAGVDWAKLEDEGNGKRVKL